MASDATPALCRIRYEVTRGDRWAVDLRRHLEAPKVRTRVTVLRLGALWLLLVSVFFVAGQRELDASVVAAQLPWAVPWVGLVGLVTARPEWASLALSRLRAGPLGAREPGGALGEHVLTVDRDHLRLSSRAGDTIVPRSSVEGIACTGRHVFVDLSARTGIAIARVRVLEGDLGRLVSELARTAPPQSGTGDRPPPANP